MNLKEYEAFLVELARYGFTIYRPMTNAHPYAEHYVVGQSTIQVAGTWPGVDQCVGLRVELYFDSDVLAYRNRLSVFSAHDPEQALACVKRWLRVQKGDVIAEALQS